MARRLAMDSLPYPWAASSSEPNPRTLCAPGSCGVLRRGRPDARLLLLLLRRGAAGTDGVKDVPGRVLPRQLGRHVRCEQQAAQDAQHPADVPRTARLLRTCIA